MRFRVEAIGDGQALVVEHADGARTLVAERDGLTATLTLSAHRVRALRHSIANTEGARKRVRTPEEGHRG